MEEPGRLQSMGWLRVRQDWATSLSLCFLKKRFFFRPSLQFVTILLLLYGLFWPWGTWDLKLLDQRLNPHPLAVKGKVLTTGPPGKLFFHLVWDYLVSVFKSQLKKISKKSGSYLCIELYHGEYKVSLPGSSVCGILQARILEWVAIPFSRGSSKPRDRT